MQKEPSVIIGAISAVVQALLALLVAFGLDISDELQNAILGAIPVVGTLITAVIIRAKVFSPASFKAATGRHLAPVAEPTVD